LFVDPGGNFAVLLVRRLKGKRKGERALTDQDTGNEEADHVEEIAGDQRTSSSETVDE
jgi:hypothetical protein